MPRGTALARSCLSTGWIQPPALASRAVGAAARAQAGVLVQVLPLPHLLASATGSKAGRGKERCMKMPMPMCVLV